MARSALATLLVVALQAGCATAGAPHPPAGPVDGIRPPQSVLVQGRSVPYARPERWTSPSVPARSSRRLTVFATGSPDRGGGECGPPAIRILTSETSTTVRVLVAGYEDAAQPGTACPAIGYLPSPHTVTLRAPLGRRRVVDAADRRSVAVLDGSTIPDLPSPPAPFSASSLERLEDRPSTIVRSWAYRHDDDYRSMTITVGPPKTLTRDQPPYGRQVLVFTVRGVPAVLYETVGDPDPTYQVQWTPKPAQAIRLMLTGSPHQRWTASKAVALARAVDRYATSPSGRLPAPRTPGTAAAEYSSADGPVRAVSNLLKSSGVYVGVSCQGSGTMTVTVRRTSFRYSCTDRLTTHVDESFGKPAEPFPLTVTANAGVRWTLVLARASLDGS